MEKVLVRTCSHGECQNPHEAKGLCGKHYQQARRGKLGQDRMPATHGSPTYYINKKCRCELCRSAWNKYCNDKKLKRVGQPLPAHKEHGRESSYHWGCRCELCTAAHAKFKRRNQRHKTTAQKAELAAAQGGPCACCGTVGLKLVADHIHGTSHVRGLICYSCNTGIGKLGDTIEGVERALMYLKENTPDALILRG